MCGNEVQETRLRRRRSEGDGRYTRAVLLPLSLSHPLLSRIETRFLLFEIYLYHHLELIKYNKAY
jgi:hypothetical protein